MKGHPWTLARAVLPALIFVSSGAQAAPSISGVSGTVSNGNSITISGSAFGSTGPTVRLFDDFESGTNGALISTTGPNVGTFSSVWPNDAPDVEKPTYSTAAAFSGSKSMRIDFENGVGLTRNAVGILFPSPSSQVYLSFREWQPSGDNTPGEGTFDGTNWKQFWFEAHGPASQVSDFVDVILADGSHYTPGNDQSNTGVPECYHSDIAVENTWVRKDWYISHSTTTGGAMWQQEIGGGQHINDCNRTGIKTTYSSHLTDHVQIPGYGRVTPNSVVHHDDLYVATGAGARARVEICNNATYSSATNCAISTPTAWGNTSITATVRAGSFTSGSAWLFVIDSAGVASAGSAVTIGGGLLDAPANFHRVWNLYEIYQLGAR